MHLFKKTKMKRNWFRKILKGFSLTSAMFIFQACYGTADDWYYDTYVEGQVISNSSGLPIPGIKVTLENSDQYETTDTNGYFFLYIESLDTLNFNFEDIDSTRNGMYTTKDTVLIPTEDEVFIEIKLEESLNI